MLGRGGGGVGAAEAMEGMQPESVAGGVRGDDQSRSTRMDAGGMREGCGRDAGGMREGAAGAESGTDDKLTSMMSAVDARRVRRARGAEEGRAFCTRDE